MLPNSDFLQTFRTLNFMTGLLQSLAYTNIESCIILMKGYYGLVMGVREFFRTN